MVRKVITLEYLKFRRYKPFWIILILFVVSYFALGLSIKTFIDFLLSQRDGPLEKFVETGFPFFDFVDIWQNLAYITFLFKYILAFVVMISVCQEYTFRTMRQNIIDGLSLREYLFSKVGLVAALSLFAGVLLLILGMILGMLYSPVKSPDFIFYRIGFVAAYVFETFCFLCLAMFVAAFIRKTGFAIILFILYTLVLEPVATAILRHHYLLETWFYPVRAINNLIRAPFGKYLFQEVQDYVALQDLLVAGGWAAICLVATYWLIRKRSVQ